MIIRNKCEFGNKTLFRTKMHCFLMDLYDFFYDYSNMRVEHRLAQAASDCAPSVEVPAIFDIKQNEMRNTARMGDCASLAGVIIATSVWSKGNGSLALVPLMSLGSDTETKCIHLHLSRLPKSFRSYGLSFILKFHINLPTTEAWSPVPESFLTHTDIPLTHI